MLLSSATTDSRLLPAGMPGTSFAAVDAEPADLLISHLDQWSSASGSSASLTWICLSDSPHRPQPE